MTLASLVEAGEFHAAYTRALRLWRRKPYAALAALVTELRVHATKVKSPNADADLESPLASSRILDVAIVGGNSIASREKVAQAFAAIPADPYVFDWMVQELGHPRFDVAVENARRLYALVVEEMSRRQDERIAPWRAQLPAFLEAHKGRRHGQLSPDEIQTLREEFEKYPFEPTFLESFTPEEEEELAAVRIPLDALKKGSANRDLQRAELFAKVCADFDDDVAKEVYADFLLEEENTLGEFIVLSLKLARDGGLPADLEARHRALRTVAREAQPMGHHFDRGFAVEACFADRLGNRRGRYGLEPGWGTIRKCDVPPTSDDCHTESLRELDLGSTFIAELTKLEKPLAVTKLHWRMPSQNGKAKWKKIKVLPKLEELVLHGSQSGSFEWLLEGPGKTVRELTIETGYWGRYPEWVAAAIADSASKGHSLTRARIGDHLVFAAKKGRTKLTISVPDSDVLNRLVRELVNTPRPLVDEVTVDGPGDATTYAMLLTLGRTSTTKLASSPAAEAATLTQTGDALVIEPSPKFRVFDAPALKTLVRTTKPPIPRHISIPNSAVINETAAYWDIAKEAGASELTLTVVPPSSRRGRFVLRATADESGKIILDVDVGRRDQVELVLEAIHSFVGRVGKVILRYSPALDGPKIAESVQAVVATVDLLPEERVAAGMFKFGIGKGRAFIDPDYTSELLRPATADLILAQIRNPKELRVGQNRFEQLVHWMAWVEKTKLAVTFARDWKINAAHRLSWDDGLVARLFAGGAWPEIVKILAGVPDQSIKHLELQSSNPAPPEAIEACDRVARTHAVVSWR